MDMDFWARAPSIVHIFMKSLTILTTKTTRTTIKKRMSNGGTTPESSSSLVMGQGGCGDDKNSGWPP